MLINVEQGAANPSVGTLLKVAPPQPDRVRITRHGDGAALWTSESGGRGVLVAGTESPDVIELWDWTMSAGDQHISEPHPHGARELLQVQQGRLVVTVADQMISLDSGDALSFPGDVAHAYANPDTKPARFSLAVFEPGAGSRSRSEANDV
jgi:quercetin dioxygenase-like cupin family protein